MPSKNSPKNKPLVSIIIPVYNVEKYLESCIESVINQLHENIEVILVNDGSTDSSGEICDRYADLDKRIRTIHQKNAGVSAARNIGLTSISGDYYAFVDGDDIVSNNYISLMLSIAQKTGADIVSAGYTMVRQYEIGDTIDQSAEKPTELMSNMEAASSLLYGKVITNHPFAKLFDKKLNQLQFNEKFSIGEDMEYVYRCILEASTIAHTSTPIYLYVQREGSAMNKPFHKKRADSYKAALSIYNSIESGNKSKDLLSAARAKLFTEAISVGTSAFSARRAHPQARKVYLACARTVKKYSTLILQDKHAKRKQKILSLSAILASPFLTFYIANTIRKIKGNRS